MLPELNCSNFEDRAVLYAAGELSVAERALVDAHVWQCAGCAAILSSELELRDALASRVQPADALDRSELLLARSRSELFEALDDAAAQPKRGWR
jgi:Putative zinc-finger